VIDDTELKKARFYALKVTNLRPRSVEEISNKLKEKGFPEDIIAQVISEFAKQGLLNDTKFSKLWVDSRMAFNPKGEKILRRELKKKGISDNDIEDALLESKKEYNEYEVVKKLADARMPSLKGLDKTTAKRRLLGYLQRRGFNFDTIMEVMRELFNKI